MTVRILVTGARGLVGSALTSALIAAHFDVVEFDCSIEPGRPGHGDIRDVDALRKAAERCVGIVHLAAVSRVAWGEKDPELCAQTNVAGTANVLSVAEKSPSKPWVLFSSSREVYGEPERLPVLEDDCPSPVNVYGRSKADAEQLVLNARRRGARVSIVRLANVYGSCRDHEDRAAPAFARRALEGLPLHVYGRENAFDFTHISDVVQGLMSVVDLLAHGTDDLPILHFVTGRPTTLAELARLAIRCANSPSPVFEYASHNYNVSRFVGNPRRAFQLLGWRATVEIENGMQALVDEFRSMGVGVRGECPA
ncbi:MAG: NAD-dependent epimerase/dehydratase family protein [Beijerinckiaceae bacterium]